MNTSTRIQGILLPFAEQEVLDAQFADDTGLFLKGTLENLQRVEVAINVFCIPLRAKINWNKIVGFWRGLSDPPRWTPDVNFKWIPRGTSVRYLGCQVGVELAPELQIIPLLMRTR